MMNVQRRPHGFTLLETLIVVGLVALLSVGIAAIFNTVGETITRGRRVSELNRSAAQLERVMRADFDRMSREGFLVIRNEYANAGQPVKQYDPARFEGVPGERPRRIDEILFFAHNETGRFETARVPMHPDLIASSDTARIYYGHGKKQIRPIVTSNNATVRRDPYFRPVLEDRNADVNATLGFDASGSLQPGQSNPNQYAADWTLLRHVMPMISPARLLPPGGLAEMDVPDIFLNAPFNFSRELLQDSRVQTAMQPSAQSLFLHIARQQSASPGIVDTPPGYRVDSRLSKPAPSSGLVDLLVTDFDEIASIVNHAAVDPTGAIYWPDDVQRFGTPFGTFFDPRSLSDRAHMQAWMLDAMPANRKGEDPGQWRERPRIRYESEPPLFSIEDQYLDSTGTGPRELERAYREADQVMLTSSIFAARCTEFIVEWSYGLVDTAAGSPTRGQLIWYGLPRYEDVNDNGSFDGGTDVILAQPFNGVDAFFAVPALVALTGRPESDFAALSKYPTRELINLGLPMASINPSSRTEVSMFGYYDPGPGLLRVGGGGLAQVDPDDRSWDSTSLADPSDDRPWLWPALIRVTMTIADAQDPSIEATHQMIFEVPQGGLDNK